MVLIWCQKNRKVENEWIPLKIATIMISCWIDLSSCLSVRGMHTMGISKHFCPRHYFLFHFPSFLFLFLLSFIIMFVRLFFYFTPVYFSLFLFRHPHLSSRSHYPDSESSMSQPTPKNTDSWPVSTLNYVENIIAFYLDHSLQLPPLLLSSVHQQVHWVCDSVEQQPVRKESDGKR